MMGDNDALWLAVEQLQQAVKELDLRVDEIQAHVQDQIDRLYEELFQ